MPYSTSPKQAANGECCLTISHLIQPYGAFFAEPIKKVMGQNIATTGKKRRVSTNKSPEPSYAIIDSQSVKTCGAAEDKGFDGGKKVKGRKRHIVVDPMGNLLGVVVHAAHIHDTKAGIFAAQKAIEAYPSIKAFSADAGYRKTVKQEMQEWFGLPVDISEKISGSWQIIPKRWIVERSFAWLGWSRRLAKDFEVTLNSAENFVTLAAIWQILKHFSD